ncbi:MAG: hypothetical protein WC379_09400 [Methanoregula sp.]|jgi:hypothetical protein
MIDQLPEGKSIGWMQSPPQWIFTHTVRFVGVVRVVIQDGEGFILIKKGKPLVYYFKHGRIELHGHGALDYFNSHPTIEFNLCKYTPEEFAQALKICNVEEEVPETESVQAQVVPVVPIHEEVFEQPAEEPPEIPRHEQPPLTIPEKPEPLSEKPLATVPVTREATVPVMMGSAIPVTREAAVPVMPGSAIPVKHVMAVPIKPQQVITDRPLIPQPAVLEDPDIKIIGQIKKLNGIVAISVFNDDRNILLMGDVEIEPLLKIARTMLATTTKITPHLDWGSFVHMTLQIPEGNVIIAPYHENNLCILTTRTINIGHIRRILRDLQQDRSPGVMM